MKAVIFDLDDTLFPESEYVLSGLRAVGARIEDVFADRGFYEMAARLFSQGHRGSIIDEALTALGLCVRPDLVESLVAHYRNHVPEIRLYEDATRATRPLPATRDDRHNHRRLPGRPEAKNRCPWS